MWREKLPSIREKALERILNDSPYEPSKAGTPGYPETFYISMIEKGQFDYWLISSSTDDLDVSSTTKRRNRSFSKRTIEVNDFDQDGNDIVKKQSGYSELDPDGRQINWNITNQVQVATSSGVKWTKDPSEYIDLKLQSLDTISDDTIKNCLCFQLYGCCEVALRNGDNEVCKSIMEKLNNIVPYQAYLDIKAKRLGDNGTIKLYRDDFPID